jgi:serine/threonine-protein kinase HipA
MAAQLSVFLGDDYVGVLSCDRQQRFSFQYNPQWIAGKDAAPLSLSLPVQDASYPDDQARPFFVNLLPESGVREAVARKLGISPGNEFALLEALGGECAGAVTLLPVGAFPDKGSGYRKLSPDKFHAIIRELPKKPFLAGEDGIRLSLAGAQNKLPVYLRDDHMFLPLGASPSSHIVKPDIEGIDGSVRNEAFCMALAKRMGVNVPDVNVMKTPDEVYVVARYDRFNDANGDIRRIHQEDVCQALGLLPGTKYEAEGGPSLADCFTLIDRASSSPALDRKALLHWVVFNYLIHNTDAHAKNLSLLLTADEVRLAPFYDLMCTGVYEGINRRLAMKIGNENRPEWIQSRHWTRMADNVSIRPGFVFQTLRDMAERMENAAQLLAAEQQARWGPASIIPRILRIISRQVKHSTSIAG